MISKDVLLIWSILQLLLLPDFSAGQPQSVGPPLRPYTTTPTSHKLEAQMDPKVVIGKPLTMWASIPANESSFEIVKCEWTSPFGVTYNVDKNVVKSVGGKVIDSFSGNVTNSKACYLIIKNLKAPAMGTWKCRIFHSASTIFQEAHFAATSNGKSLQMRLPKYIQPQKYVIFLTPFIIKDNFTIQSQVEIDILVTQKKVKTIILHSQVLKIFENTVKVIGNDKQNFEILGLGYEKAAHLFYIHLAQDLPVNARVKLYIDYLGDLNSDLMGFYRSSYFDEDTNSTEYIATTQFEAVGARKALPCFDEPAFKAVFKVSLGRIKDMTSISNMPKEKEGVPMADNNEYVWDIYKETPKMSTYLLAFVVSRFTFRQSKTLDNGVEFRTWSRKSVMDQTVLAAEIGPKLLHFFEMQFKIPYPLPKQDVIAVPDFIMGAMENWGLITYREVYLLFKEGKSSAAQQAHTELVIAHEISHQWFGNLVTMEWWTDLWLNEGFARYMQNFGAAHIQKKDTGDVDRIVTSYTMTVMDRDALQSSHPVSMITNDPDVILSNFDSISYDKGASIIRMMANFIGSDTFDKGIVAYLNKYKFGNAAKDDLWQVLTETAHKSGTLSKTITIKEIMDTWTVQMGFPVINVEIINDKAPVQIKVSQKRFLLFEDKTKKEDNTYRWWIPISYTTPGGNFNGTKNWLWLSPKEETKVFTLTDIKNPNDTFIFNIQHFGFYRVNYSPRNWESIYKSLQTDLTKIHRLNRAQIIKDSLSLARAGLLDYKIALGSTKYLSKELEYIPWSPALSELKYLGQMLQKTAGALAYKYYIFKQLDTTFERLGLSPKDSDSFMDIQLRALVVETLCSLEYEPCVKKSLELFEKRNSAPEKFPIPSDVRQTVFCTVLAKGGQKEWDQMWQLYLSSSDNLAQREDLLNALGCSKVSSILQKLLEMSISSTSGIRSQDGITVITGIAKNPEGRDLTWSWLESNWDAFAKHFDVKSGKKVGNVIKSCTETFNLQDQLEKLERFYKKNQDNFGTGLSDAQSSIQTVKANVQWVARQFQDVSTWFKNEMTSKSQK